MSAISLTPAQVSAAVSATAQRTPAPIVSPVFNGVQLRVYHAPDGWHAIVYWPGEIEQDIVLANSVPGSELTTLQTALGRVLIDARTQAGAV